MMSRKSARILLVLGMGAFFLYFTCVAYERHDHFYSRRLDLGNMDQTVWNLLHGHGFTLTDPMGPDQQSRLAVHADFLLILLTPLYLLWSSPKTLIVVQTAVLAVGALPLFWLAHKRLGSYSLALLFAVAYLLYPPLQRMSLHDFHAVALSTTFLLFAYWYLGQENFWAFSLFALLAALGKEQVWLVVGLMGLYIALIKRRIPLGLTVAGLGFTVFALLFWVFIPRVSVGQQHWALTYLSQFGSTQDAIAHNILVSPWAVVTKFVSVDRLIYYFQLLAPVGFLPLLSPATLLFAAPDILINTLSNNDLFRSIDYQYTSLITPWIFVAAIDGLARLRRRRFRFVGGCFIVATIVSVVLWGELPLGFGSRFWFFTSTIPEASAMQRVEASVPSNATVSATNNIGAHFSQRQFLYNFPINADSADYVVVLLGDPYAWPSGDAQLASVHQLLENSSYTLIAQHGMFYAFARKAKL